MSLYSKNRFSNLSPERAVNIKTLTENSILNPGSSNDDIEEDIIESSYFNDIEFDKNTSDPLSIALEIEDANRLYSIESTENELKSMINESMMILVESNFAEVKAAEITGSLYKASNSIKKYGKKLHTKVSTLIIRDNKKNQIYIDAIEKVPNNKYPGINGLTFPSRAIFKNVEKAINLDRLVKFTIKTIDGIVSETNEKELQGYVEELKIYIESIFNDFLKVQTTALNRKGSWKPQSQDLAILKDYTNGRYILNSITQCTGKMDKSIDVLINHCNSLYKGKKIQNDPLTRAKISTIKRCITAFCSFTLLNYNDYSDTIIGMINAYKKALTGYGKYCIRAIKGKSVNESIVDVVEELAAELYVNESLK